MGSQLAMQGRRDLEFDEQFLTYLRCFDGPYSLWGCGTEFVLGGLCDPVFRCAQGPPSPTSSKWILA